MLLCSGIIFQMTTSGTWHIASWALLSGALFVFFDFLTNPAAAVMLLVFAVISAALGQRQRPQTALLWSFIAGAMWSVGYAATWLAKWAVAAYFLGITYVEQNILGAVSFRVSGANALVDSRLGAGIVKNWGAWLDQATIVRPVIVACVVVIIIAVVPVLRESSTLSWYLLLYSGIPFIPLLWYLVVSNHSQIHAWFTYRSLPTALACVTAGFVGTAIACRQSNAYHPSRP
jgi:hypothetical protein